MIKQRTLLNTVTISGIGLHTGKQATITIHPAPVNHWFKFKRIDAENQPTIPVDADFVTDTARGTTISHEGASVSTIEHLIAALLGMNYDNALIEIDGPEVPIMDGSSAAFVALLETAGNVEQDAERQYFELKNDVVYEDTEKGVEFLAVPTRGGEYRITVMVDYNSEVLGTQHAGMLSIEDFKTQIAPCRTFVFLHELEMLLTHGLAKGGDLNNAIVLVAKEVDQVKLDELAVLFNKPKVQVKGKGVLNNTELKFYNEPARHKLLDIVGDLALVGMHIKGHVLAARPGHAGNVAFAKVLKGVIKEEKQKFNKNYVTPYDTNKPAVMQLVDIEKMLPHRYPFLLVDRIMELTESSVVGLKNVTFNEPFFVGHFPGNPVMPGVLQIEAMAQVGGILVLKTVPDPENYLTYFMKIDNVKFKHMVVPGDTIVFKLELITPIRRGICHMRGVAQVNDKIVMEAEMMAQIVKVKN
jgi:UDP-3-O-[3-hydroxymyristoyl] N-acetylglucosamine deacetylase / 3-hydroxyacyl-[acyl-carrier-protein] dehydratase